jgi:hypothetical protein
MAISASITPISQMKSGVIVLSMVTTRSAGMRGSGYRWWRSPSR